MPSTARVVAVALLEPGDLDRGGRRVIGGGAYRRASRGTDRVTACNRGRPWHDGAVADSSSTSRSWSAACVVTLPLELVLGDASGDDPAGSRSRSPRRSSCSSRGTSSRSRTDQWTFAPRYVTGWELPGDLPVEEVVFFVVIPICGLLTLEAVRRMLGDTARA